MQAPGAGDSMLQVMIAFGVYLGFQLMSDAAEFPEPSRRGHGRKPDLPWRDAEAPASWQPLLAARDKAAEWYVARAMPSLPEGARLILEWGLFAVGVLSWVALVSLVEMASLHITALPLLLGGLEVFAGAVLLWYGIYFTLDKVAQYRVWDPRDRGALDTLVLQAVLALARDPGPAAVFARPAEPESLPNPGLSPGLGDAKTSSHAVRVAVEAVAPVKAIPHAGFDGLGQRLYECCGAYTGPVAPPRPLRQVLAQFWWPLVSVGSLVVFSAGMLGEAPLVPTSSRVLLHSLHDATWVLVGAYAYLRCVGVPKTPLGQTRAPGSGPFS